VSTQCTVSKQSPQQDEKQPLSKLFVSGSINGEEEQLSEGRATPGSLATVVEARPTK
jgi:hypothetical protein